MFNKNECSNEQKLIDLTNCQNVWKVRIDILAVISRCSAQIMIDRLHAKTLEPLAK